MVETLQSLLSLNTSAITVLSVAVLCDIVTGLVKATLNHDLKSSKFKDGLLKKSLDYILVVIGTSLDVLCKTSYISSACIYCLIAMEFYSVLENVREYLPLPELLIKILDMLQKKGEINEQ